MLTAGYRFLDHPVQIASDEPELPGLFENLFHPFRVEGPLGSDRSGTHIELISRPGPGQEAPLLRCDGESIRLARPPWLLGHAFSVAMGRIFDQVPSHFVLHGGAVTSGDRGIILSGPSSAGKTTLVLELVRRGFGYLSDDVAAVCRDSKRLEPFPKRAAVRKRTLTLLGLDSAPTAPSPTGRGFGAKRYLDMADLPGGTIGSAAPVRLVLFLDARAVREVCPSRDRAGTEEDHFIDIGLFHGEDPVLRESPVLIEMRSLDGADLVSSRRDEGIEVVRFRLRTAARLTKEVLGICRRHRDVILYTERSKAEKSVFPREPEIRTLSPSEGVVELLRDMKNRSEGGRLLARLGGSIPRLYFELADALDGAVFYRLTPGEPGRTAELVDELVGSVR